MVITGLQVASNYVSLTKCLCLTTPTGRTEKVMADFKVAEKALGRRVIRDGRRERLHEALDRALNGISVKPFHSDLEKMTLANNDFRRVVFTGAHEQLVLMSLKPGENIGNEVHPGTDQFFRIEQGTAEFTLGNGREVFELHDGGGAIVPAGTWHDVKAVKGTVKLYTLYSPPNHPAGTVEHTKAEASEKGK